MNECKPEHARDELSTAIRIIELDQYPVGVEHVDAPHLPTSVQEGFGRPGQLIALGRELVGQGLHVTNPEGDVADADLVQLDGRPVWLLPRMAGQS